MGKSNRLFRGRLGSRHGGADFAHGLDAVGVEGPAFDAGISGGVLAGIGKAVPAGGEVGAIGVAMGAHGAVA